jgi:hypothetical protein
MSLSRPGAGAGAGAGASAGAGARSVQRRPGQVGGGLERVRGRKKREPRKWEQEIHALFVNYTRTVLTRSTDVILQVIPPPEKFMEMFVAQMGKKLVRADLARLRDDPGLAPPPPPRPPAPLPAPSPAPSPPAARPPPAGGGHAHLWTAHAQAARPRDGPARHLDTKHGAPQRGGVLSSSDDEGPEGREEPDPENDPYHSDFCANDDSRNQEGYKVIARAGGRGGWVLRDARGRETVSEDLKNREEARHDAAQIRVENAMDLAQMTAEDRDFIAPEAEIEDMGGDDDAPEAAPAEGETAGPPHTAPRPPPPAARGSTGSETKADGAAAKDDGESSGPASVPPRRGRLQRLTDEEAATLVRAQAAKRRKRPAPPALSVPIVRARPAPATVPASPTPPDEQALRLSPPAAGPAALRLPPASSAARGSSLALEPHETPADADEAPVKRRRRGSLAIGRAEHAGLLAGAERGLADDGLVLDGPPRARSDGDADDGLVLDGPPRAPSDGDADATAPRRRLRRLDHAVGVPSEEAPLDEPPEP